MGQRCGRTPGGASASPGPRRTRGPDVPRFAVSKPPGRGQIPRIETQTSNGSPLFLRRRRALGVLAFLGFWTVVGLAFAAQMYLTQIKYGEPIPWQDAARRSMGDWYTFALLSLPAIGLARRFPLGSAPLRLLLTLHLIASGVFALVWTLLRTALAVWLEGREFTDTLRYALVATLVFNVLVYWVIVVATHAVGFYRESQARERRELELERRLTEARLQALQMQLNPHFLFNALHGISTLMYRDVDAADRMLIRLSELLRHALDRSGEHSVPLSDELAFLDRYLDIEQIRFAEHLEVRREIDPSVLGIPVPSLILQPLVENAIKHGIEPQVRAGVITLRARRPGPGRLRLEVEDNGAGLDPGRTPESGIGLANCRSRLSQLYGNQASLTLGPGSDRGLKVVLELPDSESRPGTVPAASEAFPGEIR